MRQRSTVAVLGAGAWGTTAAKYVKSLSKQHRLKMPISTGLYRILNKELKPVEFLQSFLDEMA